MAKPILYLVIPCYNEQDVLPISNKIFINKLESLITNNTISKDSKILFINDGSKDNTWLIINNLSKQNEHIIGITLSRNKGHQNALLAGLMTAMNNCDVAISIDCDGQDDINAIDEMLKKYTESNCEIVYAARNNRKTDTFFKRNTALGFYKLMKMFNIDSVYNHADYRLLSNKALNALSEYKEVNLFLRGMIPLIGFKNDIVYYDRSERLAGKTHYPLSKMINFAIDGITSLSIKPMNIITTMGLISSFLSFIGLIVCICLTCFIPEFTLMPIILATICLFGSLQLFTTGLIGIYIGKTYMETKHRPRYIIENTTENAKYLQKY